MPIRRITISIPVQVAARLKKAAGDFPVSRWVTRLIEDRLDDDELNKLWEEFYRSVQPNRDDMRQANAIFSRLTREGRRKKAS